MVIKTVNEDEFCFGGRVWLSTTSVAGCKLWDMCQYRTFQLLQNSSLSPTRWTPSVSVGMLGIELLMSVVGSAGTYVVLTMSA
jgi:hypothetical protein